MHLNFQAIWNSLGLWLTFMLFAFGHLHTQLSSWTLTVALFHRLIAFLVMGWLIINFIKIYRSNLINKRNLIKTLTLSILLFILLIILGIIASFIKFSPSILAGFLGLAMLFFMTLILFKEMQGHNDRACTGTCPYGVAIDMPHRFHRFILFVTVTFYLQILWGAYVRHSGAGLVCPDFPLCQGQWMPNAFLPQVHILHRMGALIVEMLILFLTFRAYTTQQTLENRRRAKRAALLTLVQITLGIGSVLSLTHPLWTTAHLMTAMLILANLVLLSYHSKPA